jgi:hypothetical protein
MGARNCQELGINLQKICSRLLANDNLVKLLYYVDLDPLEKTALTTEQKQKIFNDLICVIPKVGTRTDSKSVIAVYVPKAAGLSGNSEYKTVTIAIDVFVPMTQWIIKDSNLRPFAIMGEIQNSLNGKTINGLGKIKGGDFELVLLTDEMSGYRQVFTITEYE